MSHCTGGGGAASGSGGGGGGSFSSGMLRGTAKGGATDTVDGRVKIIETTHTLADAYFTSCGAQGRLGPTQSNCVQVYTGTQAGSMLEQVVGGIQIFKISTTGTYRLTAYGARGGNGRIDNPNYRGGDGAKVWGTFTLKKDDRLYVVVGQPGNTRAGTGQIVDSGGGGGGGTFVWLNDEDVPLLVAGGGGGQLLAKNRERRTNDVSRTETLIPFLSPSGASYFSSSSLFWGVDGSDGIDGTDAKPYGGRGGHSGYGGSAPGSNSVRHGGGGGGWLDDGNCKYQLYCGKGRLSGFLGGLTSSPTS